MMTQTAQPTSPRTPTVQQQAVYDHVQAPNPRNLVIEAVAGSGKTTTIVEASRHLQGRILFLAFNKSIVNELQDRLPRTVEASTFHSLCLRALRNRFPQAARRRDWVDANKPRAMLGDLVKSGDLTTDEVRYLSGPALKAFGLAQQYGIGCLAPDTDAAWLDLCGHYDLTPKDLIHDGEFVSPMLTGGIEIPVDLVSVEDDRDAEPAAYTLGLAVTLARHLLRLTVEQAETRISFDDMLYLIPALSVRLPRFDWVLVDESQDTNLVQRAILRELLASGGKLIAVGDRRQAIYGFRGADSDALPAIEREFDCVTLPLSVSFRCPASVVRLAQTIVPHIEARPNAPEGSVQDWGDYTNLLTTLTPKDYIICRNAAPLVALAFTCLRRQIPVRFTGRDIGEGVVNLVEKLSRSKIKDDGTGRLRAVQTIEDLQVALAKYLSTETARLTKRDELSRIALLEDRADIVRIAIDNLPEWKRTIQSLIGSIDALFRPVGGEMLTLSTIHGSKGLERDRVCILDRWLMPSKWAKKSWEMEQEANLTYVAYTRAKADLVFLSSPPKPKEA